MKADELREMTLEEIRAKRKDLSKELSMLKFQHVTSQLENPLKIRLTRRDMARVETILNEKGSEGNEESGDGN